MYGFGYRKRSMRLRIRAGNSGEIARDEKSESASQRIAGPYDYRMRFSPFCDIVKRVDAKEKPVEKLR
jgi:hypothetical protein